VARSTSGAFESLLYYRADGTSEYVSIMEITGTLGGRSGSFVLQGAGNYDGKTARVATTVVPGSGTGELAGFICAAGGASSPGASGWDGRYADRDSGRSD